jgi:hypothetical protein
VSEQSNLCYRQANPEIAATTKDLPIGKIRIRLSTLESDRVYTNAYPLLIVTPQGIKKMGELELAVRLSSASTLNLMHAYLQPPLPRMHYFYPLDHKQIENLRVAAMNIVALRLMRSEPAMRQEVVQFMLDTDAERWSMRRSKANYYRIMVNQFGFENFTPDLSEVWHLLVICLWSPGELSRRISFED